MRLYRFLRRLALWLIPRLLRLQVQGSHNVPENGPFIIAANHFNVLDPIMVAISVPHHISFMAKEEVMHSRILGWLVLKVGSFPVKRNKADVKAFRRSLQTLKAGGVLGIFPEGTRGEGGEVQAAFSGTALLAARENVPIVPVALYGEYRLGGSFSINIGEPFMVECKIPGKPTAEERSKGTDLVMANIADLLTVCRERD